MNHFKILKKSSKSNARLSVLKTAHGKINGPFFMPVATQGTVKHISTSEMKELNAQILLSNTYHLMLRPGEKLIKKFGGLHDYIKWPKPILTDSGGFQVFSLAGTKNRTGQKLVKLTDEGVAFKSYIDGKEFFLTPEKALQIQADLGVDIAVCLDECVALPAEKKYIEKSVELTTVWARRSKVYQNKFKNKPLLHCVIQGGLDKDLRLKSLHDLKEIGFDGYNIGGLAVGETNNKMFEVLDYLVPEMPADKPRYLMGVGYPEQILEAVKKGVDMFDCVIPTREGRHGRIFQWSANYKELLIRKITTDKFYKTVNITNAKYTNDKSPINPDSSILELRTYTKAYLNYLFKIKEPLGMRLASLNNLEFYLKLTKEIRNSIKNGQL